ncbi:MAG: DUF4278 domain-containing protein [Synechococcales bacterium]|nr:DUF4278 domain-containing protein [Synechococcales bacterium]
MKLVYRGASYEQTPSHIEVEDLGLMGNYRGHELHFHQAKRQGVGLHDIQLHYRGAAYTAHVGN